MNESLVSIIMPSFNSATYIAESIESILRQTYTDWELLVVDDCSTDETIAIVSQYAAQDKRIRLFRLEKNMGSGHSRNHGMTNAEGRYLAFCDSDDLWLPHKLERQMAFMRERECGIVYGSYLVCNDDGERCGIIIAPKRQTLQQMKRDSKIGFLTVVIDTQKCPKIPMPTLRKRQDWAYLLMILQHCGVAYAVQEPIAIYRHRKTSLSAKKFGLIAYAIQVYQLVFGYTKVQAYAYLFCVFLPNYFWKRFRVMCYQRRYRHLLAEY
ncbi:MAG: glycosyltransferase family 2 protein [Alloprevotella sp.]